MSSRPKTYHEPWSAEPRRSGPVPAFIPTDEMDPDAAARQADAQSRAESAREWVVWGTGNGEPGEAPALMTGVPASFDDRRPILFVRDGPTARRIAECVSAFAGVESPSRFMAGVRELLLSLARGECDGSDIRVVGLLARCIPPDELKEFNDEPTS